MSFSVKTKNELAQIISHKKCCQLAELAALFRMDGTIQISAYQKISLAVITENAAVARKIFKLTKERFGIQTEILVHKKNRLKKNNVYSIRIPPQPQVANVLRLLGFVDGENNWVMNYQKSFPSELVRDVCCKKAYLRGAFLGGGSVNNPEGTYHLEIISNNKDHAEIIADLMHDFHLPAKISRRKNWYVVYLKESDQIVNCLNVLGAHQALLDFENTRIMKEMRNQVNRLVNCETANLNKTVDAAVRQIEAINLIEATTGLNKLSPALKQVAELRLAYPDLSLKELGETATPKIGKSGISHRMRKLEMIADRLKEHNK
ncbi:DNA-binding protein WhiA [Dehalobacterium formicoaceticum]|uniref:Probable cell division protein WhiA n=1 Tax=Dehalobacterium formicoaceticum TaxID=51515 RepID=A0ABT1Y2S3_9FIRM|nr:DNA-binding protein WhiA [Dehalobacterium formicoaceticum]MCR6545166.1 DNA-binding protein WhiA [Dehalobacterium formicoaceticum]